MTLFVVALIFVLALMSMVLHEYAHGYAAFVSGDSTAYSLGRLTMNPLVHIDPIMTVLLPALLLYATEGRFLFGGAKPVPINPFLFRHLERDYRFVSVAGVAVNLMIAAFSALLIHILKLDPADAGGLVIGMVAYFNLLLAVFNLVPVPPLDGSRILRTFLPTRARDAFDRMDRFGLMILIILMYLGVFNLVFAGINFVWTELFLLKSFPLGSLLYSFNVTLRSAFQ
ncbi:MAG: site-2 protease family protein [Planctomycetota bacterium]